MPPTLVPWARCPLATLASGRLGVPAAKVPDARVISGHRAHGTRVGGMSSVVGWTIRILVGAFLVLLGIFSLPLVAIVLDGDGQEGWIIPVQVVLVTLVGAAVGYALPLLAGEGALRSRGALIGVLTGLVGVVLGLVMYFLVLSGFDSM